MTPDLVEYPDREMLTISLANRIASQLAQHLRTNDQAVLCVPGGSTPAPVFRTLSGADLDWSRVTVLLNDERWVDRDSPRSNSALLARNLFQGPAAAAQYLDLYTGAPTPADAAPALAEQVSAVLPITVLLLGMGNDMHTASLFPRAEGLAEALSHDAPAVMAMTGGDEAEPRVTLTLPALKSALWTHVMITGTDKREALERAADFDPQAAPIRAFLDDATVHWAE
ncbi:6-phosphogluconolactonase [Paracoccus pacificus]|uniref:6-phosphogluconolactonase n=1 Tax=Paracoccus pacificus TaxID=1463598 RepID=A0ABW4R7V5_9RHOB